MRLEFESITNIPINVEVRRIISPRRFEKIIFIVNIRQIIIIVSFL